MCEYTLDHFLCTAARGFLPPYVNLQAGDLLLFYLLQVNLLLVKTDQPDNPPKDCHLIDKDWIHKIILRL